MPSIKENNHKHTPLAEQLRPQKLSEFVGQEELVSQGVNLKDLIGRDQIGSLIFWGPPGSGKTTLANIIAHETKANYVHLSAVSSGKSQLNNIVTEAQRLQPLGQKTILFLDEIHRWNKAQQDALLPWVENGTIILIGATTENPSFSLTSALLSRMRVFVLHELSTTDLEKILERGINFLRQTNPQLQINPEAQKLISQLSNGDARIALNTLEICVQQNSQVDSQLVKQTLQKLNLRYDRDGEEHYNIISALHKSMRGSDANAAIYWLARMTEGGEDPVYIARRLVRFASEDIGLADNFALILANATFTTCQNIGWPECSVALTQCVIYLSRTKKSIQAYQAYGRAKKDIEQFGNLPVPLHIRNAPTKLMKNLGYGSNYKYTPLEDSSNQTYLPPELEGRKYI
jgi:putative ATPase